VGRASVWAHRFSDSCVRRAGADPYWRDVGTVHGYWEANIDLTRVTPDLDLYDPDWPIFTESKQLAPAKFIFDDDKRRGAAMDSVVADGCVVSGGLVRRSLLSREVRVNSYASVEESVLLPQCQIGRRARLRRTIVDRGVTIPEGLVIGEDHEADTVRFHRSDTGITLVTQEMIDALR
jgi:glucose-1-phosphate adenylyltransferase